MRAVADAACSLYPQDKGCILSCPAQYIRLSFPGSYLLNYPIFLILLRVRFHLRQDYDGQVGGREEEGLIPRPFGAYKNAEFLWIPRPLAAG